MKPADGEPLLLIELRRYRDTLVDHGPEALAVLWSEAAEGLETADAVAEFVATGMADREAEVAPYRRVIHPRLRVARSPLLATLHRHRHELRAGASEHLFRIWNIELRRLTAPQIAGEVSRRLGSPECACYLRTGDPSEALTDRVYLVISRFETMLIPGAVADLTSKWRAELGRFESVQDLIEQLVRRLSSPAFSGFLKPGVTLPKTGEAALRAAIERYPELVPSGRVEPLFQGWKSLFAHLPPERVAGLVAQKLGAEN